MAHFEADPILAARQAEPVVIETLAHLIRGRAFDDARDLVAEWRAATPEFQGTLEGWENTATSLPPSDGDLETQARVLDAMNALGQPPRPETLRGFGRMTGEGLRYLIVGRLSGDEGERQAALASTSVGGRRGPETLRSHSFEEWQSAARAVLRVPARYSGKAPESSGREIRIETSEEVARDIMLAAREEGWGLSGRVLAKKGTFMRRRYSRQIYFCLRAQVMTDDGPLAVSAVVPIGSTMAWSDSDLRLLARQRIQLLGWEDDAQPEVELDWPGTVISPLGDEDVPGAPQMSAEGLVGSDACRHRAAHWNPKVVPHALVLQCDECRRERIAIVPAHRLPADNPVATAALDEEASYLSAERARAALLGQTLDVESIADLRAREGVASLGPDDHLPGVAAMPGRTQSLRSVLSRR